MRERIRTKHYSIRTEAQYVQWVRRFILYHGKRHPRDVGAPEVEAFLALSSSLNGRAMPKTWRKKYINARPDPSVLEVFPNEAAITQLVGAILLEQNDQWAVQRARYMTRETMTEMLDPPPSICPLWQPDNRNPDRPVAHDQIKDLHHVWGHDRAAAPQISDNRPRGQLFAPTRASRQMQPARANLRNTRPGL